MTNKKRICIALIIALVLWIYVYLRVQVDVYIFDAAVNPDNGDISIAVIQPNAVFEIITFNAEGGVLYSTTVDNKRGGICYIDYVDNQLHVQVVRENNEYVFDSEGNQIDVFSYETEKRLDTFLGWQKLNGDQHYTLNGKTYSCKSESARKGALQYYEELYLIDENGDDTLVWSANEKIQ